ncbi:MAG TPA: RodZ domain-containing protein [Bryobacteraceae bacterium]|nr:RodZ domain-containing protein [Bryobacteraceae bacterium]
MPVTGIGEELQRERIRQGLTLEDIVRRTKIPVRSLEAIESNAFDRIPGVVFARNFVRLYALDLKLDPESLIARLPRFDLDSAPLPDPPRTYGRNQWDPRVKAALVSAVWLIVAGAAGTGAWYYYNNYGRHLVASVAAAPPPITPSRPVSIPPPPGATAPQSTATVPEAQTPDAAQPQLPETPAPVEQAKTGPLDTNRPVQVVLTARDVVWVQVSADGRTAFVGTLQPNDTRTIAADDQVKVLMGNAGGLDISLNGKPLDPLGTKGQTRTVRLTAAGPQFAPRNPPVSSPL